MKFFPTRTFLRRHSFVILIDGIRKAESQARSQKYKEPFTRYWNMRNRYVIHPLLEWTDRQLASYLQETQL